MKENGSRKMKNGTSTKEENNNGLGFCQSIKWIRERTKEKKER